MDEPRARRRHHAARMKRRMRALARHYGWDERDPVVIGKLFRVHGAHRCPDCNRLRARYGPRFSERRALLTASLDDESGSCAE